MRREKLVLPAHRERRRSGLGDPALDLVEQVDRPLRRRTLLAVRVDRLLRPRRHVVLAQTVAVERLHLILNVFREPEHLVLEFPDRLVAEPIVLLNQGGCVGTQAVACDDQQPGARLLSDEPLIVGRDQRDLLPGQALTIVLHFDEETDGAAEVTHRDDDVNLLAADPHLDVGIAVDRVQVAGRLVAKRRAAVVRIRQSIERSLAHVSAISVDGALDSMRCIRSPLASRRDRWRIFSEARLESFEPKLPRARPVLRH